MIKIVGDEIVCEGVTVGTLNIQNGTFRDRVENLIVSTPEQELKEAKDKAYREGLNARAREI